MAIRSESESIPAMHIVKHRKRRFTPKTRTGCLICRARRVKCDEAQPSCRRCMKGNHVCRYASDQATHLTGRQSQREVRSVEAADSNADISLARSLLPTYGSLEETCYLSKFLLVSAPWLSRFDDGSFFYTVLPQRSWRHPALRHVLVAIAMATEQSWFQLKYPTSKQHHWHHRQALRHIYTADRSEADEEVVLLASAMMFLHDNITYNSHTAVVHIQGFLHLLIEYRTKRQQRGLPPTDFESQLLRRLFFHSDVSGNAFTQVRDSDIVDSIRRRLRDPAYKDRFPGINGACDELRLGLTAIPHASRTLSERDESGLNSDVTDGGAPLTITELRTFFEKWYRTFDAVPDLTPTDRVLLECHYICAALALQFHEIGSISHAAFPIDAPQSIDQMEYVMNRLESLDIASVQQMPGRKDIELPLGQILSQIICLTNSADIRTRAYDYLRRAKRIEGLWSMDMIADGMSISHPPDGSERPPTELDNFNPPLKYPLCQTLERWHLATCSQNTEDTSSQILDFSQAFDTMTARSGGVAVETTEIQPSYGTKRNSSSVPHTRCTSGEIGAGTIEAGSQQLNPVHDEEPEEEYAAELLKGDTLVDDMLLGQTTWTRNVTPQWRQLRAEEYASLNSRSGGRAMVYE